MRRIERAAYSGLGNDIPAPNTYQPKYTLTKKSQKNPNINLFKTRRLSPFEATKFIDNSMPSNLNPGPGSYQLSQYHLTGTKASTSLAGQSSFASSNQRFKYQLSTSPGPADYGSLNQSTNSTKKAKQMAKLGPLSSKSCAALKEKAPRLTTHFTLDPHFPFSQASFIQNPGPGKYGKEKGINLRTLILQEESVRYPFNSSSARILMGTQPEALGPGPGSYNPLKIGKFSPLNIAQNTQLSNTNFQTNISPFGSSISRFKFSYVQQGNSTNPGPGQYQAAVSNLQKSFIETQSKFLNKTTLNDDLKVMEQNQEGLTVQKLRNDRYGFLSKSPRFQAYNGNNPYIMELNRSNSFVNKQPDNQQQSPGLLSRDLQNSIKEAENRKSMSTFKYQKKLQEFKKENERTLPFRSTTPRFTDQFGESKMKRGLPGPGAYEVVRPKSQMERRTITYQLCRSPVSMQPIRSKPAFGTTQQRFKKFTSQSSSNKLGPGHYNSCTNLMGTKKSFNSTISEIQ